MTDTHPWQLELDRVREHMLWTRKNTEMLLDDVALDRWYDQPAEGINHIAWQVGHIAMAQYGLALLRQRGRQQPDRELIPKSVLRAFAKDSTPSSAPLDDLAAAEIRSVFDRVHIQVLEELESYPLEKLAEPVEPPYAGQANRLGALWMSVHHEVLHAGQIGMLRRLLGYPPLER